MDTYTSGTQRRVGRAISPYNYVSSGETSEKVGCSIGSAWVGAGAAFDECGHGEVWGESKGEWMGTRSVFLWGTGFSVLSRRIARRVSSLIWVVLGERLAVVGVVLGERLAVVGENCLQEGKGSICRKQVLDGSA